MNTNSYSLFNRGVSRLRNRAFTIPELMTGTAIFLMVSGGVLVGHLFGMRLLEVNGPRTEQTSNRALGGLVADIRSAKLLLIGNGTAASFRSVDINTTQAGNAIQAYPSTDTNVFIRYFWDAGDLKRSLSGGPETSVVHSISNSLVFTAEDYAGNVLTNFQNNSLVGVNFQFDASANTANGNGNGNGNGNKKDYSDPYQLRTRVMRRALD
jgi:hypothetical protein